MLEAAVSPNGRVIAYSYAGAHNQGSARLVVSGETRVIAPDAVAEIAVSNTLVARVDAREGSQSRLFVQALERE